MCVHSGTKSVYSRVARTRRPSKTRCFSKGDYQPMGCLVQSSSLCGRWQRSRRGCSCHSHTLGLVKKGAFDRNLVSNSRIRRFSWWGKKNIRPIKFWILIQIQISIEILILLLYVEKMSRRTARRRNGSRIYGSETLKISKFRTINLLYESKLLKPKISS